ncbi:hypothetical protein [Methanobrevibacter sp.]|uniref:hypothetical protein n=1 Tax=Methanobrevibacter sp. TaxID=66852 RepID=UPI003870918D
MKSNEEKICIEIDNMEMYGNIYNRIIKHCELCEGGPKDFSIPGDGDNDWRYECGVYKFLENHALKDLVKELGELCAYVTLKDCDTKEVIHSVGKIIISFDKIDLIKIGTFEKLDKLKQLKTEFGYCKSYDVDSLGIKGPRPIEGMSARNMGFRDVIILVSNSLDNLVKLDLLIENQVLDIDSNFEVDFDMLN